MVGCWYSREDYATIDNAEMPDGDYGNDSCSSTPLAVPARSRLGDWDAELVRVSACGLLRTSEAVALGD